jgi:hypothetical protein
MESLQGTRKGMPIGIPLRVPCSLAPSWGSPITESKNQEAATETNSAR